MPHKEGHIGKENLNFSAGVEFFAGQEKRQAAERRLVQSGESTKARGAIAKQLIEDRPKRPKKD